MIETIDQLSTMLYFESIPNEAKQHLIMAIKELHTIETGKKATINKLIELYDFPEDIKEIYK